MTQREIQAILHQEYDQQRWLEVLRKILPGTDVFASPQIVPVSVPNAPQAMQLGRVRLGDRTQLAVLEVKVGDRIDLLRNRVGLRNLVARFIDQAEYHGVLAVFLAPRSDFRFTFAARMADLDERGNLVRRETAPRRYTYILGPNESCRTAAERFMHLSEKGLSTTMEDVTDAFSVEKLNNEFFAAFRKAFDIVVKDVLARNQAWERADAERETQTLLSRLLFLYFIQRKGWLNRRRDYLISAFNRYDAEDTTGTSFHDKFLRYFFVKLSDEDAFFPQLDLGDLPFLNGGLFDDESGSLTARGRMRIGNPAFRQVFDDLLEAYNFTVREDTPLDQEVAIDPEMLGKIFESLVLQLEQSDTGGRTSRHDTGSYYTPRPIVHYLCREGLSAWLEQFPYGNSGDWPARLEKLFALEAADGLDDAGRATLNELLTPNEARSLDDRLDAFRACDPAVGSGAFLVGLLHELVNLHRLCQTRARGKDPATDNEWLYETKKRIIENVLYGVDIQQRAVEICKLRLWISLMVDYPLEVDPDNCALPDFRRALKRITPLPNLDFKIRRADSLIEQIRGHAIKFPQTATDSRDFALSLNRLATAKHRFYEARLKKDKRLAQLDALDATAELAKYEFSAAKLKYGLLPGDKDAERMIQLAAAEAEMAKLQMRIAVARKKGERDKDDEIERLSSVFNDEDNPTFVWQLDFAEIFHRPAVRARADSLLPDENTKPISGNLQRCGFDLVLANPPYVRMELFKAIKPYLREHFGFVHSERADLYCYFYARGVEMLAPGGVLSFISSNKFFRAGYGEPLRRFLTNKTQLRAVIDFGDLPIFDAITYPCIVVARNCEPNSSDFINTLNVRNEDELARFTDIPTIRLPQSGFGWRLESPATLGLLTKMRKGGEPLGTFVKGNIFMGIKSGCNEAFIINSAKRAEIVLESPKAEAIIKPYLGGKNVRKWVCEYTGQWMLYLPHGISTKDMEAVLRHLGPFRNQLENRATEQAWYELQQPQEKFTAAYGRPKIIFPDIASDLRFAYDPKGAFFSNTAYCIASDSRYLLGILNSAAVQYFYVYLSAQIRGGYLRFWTQYVEQIPIPAAPLPERTAIEKLVEQCLAARGENCGTWESEINERVCRLYGLTPDEIKLVDEAATRK
jgi:hypothetical protein